MITSWERPSTAQQAQKTPTALSKDSEASRLQQSLKAGVQTSSQPEGTIRNGGVRVHRCIKSVSPTKGRPGSNAEVLLRSPKVRSGTEGPEKALEFSLKGSSAACTSHHPERGGNSSTRVRLESRKCVTIPTPSSDSGGDCQNWILRTAESWLTEFSRKISESFHYRPLRVDINSGILHECGESSRRFSGWRYVRWLSPLRARGRS